MKPFPGIESTQMMDRLNLIFWKFPFINWNFEFPMHSSFASFEGWLWNPLQQTLCVFLQLQEIDERFRHHD